MKHLIGVLKMALIWTIFWGIIGAIIATLSGLFNISDTAWLDPWIALAIPGFFGGMIFYILLQITEGDRFFYSLPVLRLVVIGVMTGLIMAVLPFLLGSSNVDFSHWLLFLMILVMTTSISAVTAVCTALILKRLVKN